MSPGDLLAAADGLGAGVRLLDEGAAPLVVDLASTTGWSGPAADAAAAARARLLRRHAQLAGSARSVEAHVRRAADALLGGTPNETADGELAAALDATVPEPPAIRPCLAGPPSGTDPRAVAAWWSGLDQDTRDDLIRHRPDLVGGLDGIPASARDRANRERLDAARAEADAENRGLVRELMRARWIGDLARVGRHAREVRARLDRLAAVDAALAGPDRELLVLEDDPTTTRAAVASGDVDTAANVGVFTPGFTAGVADLSERLDELDGVRRAAGPGTAMVAWYGYDAPKWDGVLDRDRSVLGEQSARIGAARLSRFLDGVDAARPTPAHLTAIGHSYGSVTTAMATGDRSTGGSDAAQDVVLLGSPGAGPRPTRPLGHEWVVEAAGDPVADAGWFGPDPNRMPGVVGLSAREVVQPDGRVLTGSHGHEQYLQPGSTSAANVADIVAGRPGDAILDRGIGAGDRLRGLVEAPGR